MEIHQTHLKKKLESSPEPDPLDPKTVEKNKRKLSRWACDNIWVHMLNKLRENPSRKNTEQL